MRSINKIIVAVQENQPVTEEELRFTILAFSAMEFLNSRVIERLVAAIDAKHQFSMDLWSTHAKKEFEIRSKSNKMPPDEYLGPGYIPGTPEYEQRRSIAKKVFEKVTGEKL